MEFKLNEYRQGVTDDELLSDVKRVAESMGDGYLSFRTYKSQGKYSENTFKNRFGSWINVLERLGLRIERTKNDMIRISDEILIDDLKRVSELLNSKIVSTDNYDTHGKFSSFTVRARFGSWANFVQKANLEQTGHIYKISDEDLFSEIERIWVSLGKQPTTTEMKKGISKYSLDTFMRRFGGWRNTLVAFIEYVNLEMDPSQTAEADMNISQDNNGDELELPKIQQRIFSKRTSRNINLRMRFIVFQRDKFRCCSCGASPSQNIGVELHVDHIVPWSKGGETEINNLQTLCSTCNLGKSNL